MRERADEEEEGGDEQGKAQRNERNKAGEG